MAKFPSYVPKKTIDAIDLDEVRMVADISEKKKISTYVVGGFVRDFLLSRPCKDIDFVTIGSGIELAQEVGKQMQTKVNIFKNFGTAMLKFGEYDLEFVGARKESYSH